MATTGAITIQATPEFRQELEKAAAELNLSVSAYIVYLQARVTVGRHAARVDRHVHEVFGRHGELMRRRAN